MPSASATAPPTAGSRCPASDPRPRRSSPRRGPAASPMCSSNYVQRAADLGGGDIRAALRGDLHVHSNWSDGSAPIEEMMHRGRNWATNTVR